jgi:hypothetical protein
MIQYVLGFTDGMILTLILCNLLKYWLSVN